MGKYGAFAMSAVRRLSVRRYRVNYYYWDECGFRHRGRKWFKTRQDAVAFCAERVQEYKHGKPKGSKLRELLTAAEFAACTFIPWGETNKRSWQGERHVLRHFLVKFGLRRLNEISPFDIEKWKLELQARMCAASVTRFLNVIR